jgi:hypothetical protein
MEFKIRSKIWKHIETQYNKYTTEMLKLGLKPSFNISVVYLLYCVSMCFTFIKS